MTNARWPDLGEVRRTLTEHRSVPEDVVAVFVGGSMARGWQHARSDADLYIVSTMTWTGESNGFSAVGLDPPRVPTNVAYIDGLRWELRYWTDDQVDQVLAKVTWGQFEDADPTGVALSVNEASLLARIQTALIVSGENWVAARRVQIDDSALRSMLTLRSLTEADSCVENAQGMLEVGDWHSAVIAARKALDHIADAVIANGGEYGLEEKWRARRLQVVASTVLPVERFWDLFTMQSFDPQRPTGWVESIMALCREVSLDIEI